MRRSDRREFLADVGRGMIIGSVGSTLAVEMGLASKALASEHAASLQFGALEPLVDLLQNTAPNRIIPVAVEKLRSGVELQQLAGAMALANARRFGGEDYDGYHTFMAIAPAYSMSRQYEGAAAALPVLKVLHRNARRIQDCGGGTSEVLHPVAIVEKPGKATGESIQRATRSADLERAERELAAAFNDGLETAFNDLLYSVQDEVDVHRVVLPWRAWAVLQLTGKEYAHALLRQSIHYCVDAEKSRLKNNRPEPGIRTTLPKLLDQYRLLGKTPGMRKVDDAWVEKMARQIYGPNRDQAADAVAAALAEGIDPEAIGEAISLASALLVLHDPGRKQAQPGKPVGSVHGASVGVHASDSANAWRNIARVTNDRNKFASLIAGAYHTAGQSRELLAEPYPRPQDRQRVTASDPKILLAQADSAIRNKDQAGACAAVHQYGALGFAAKPVFEMLLRYATSEDGALHAEKYFQTVSEEFRSVRAAFRWRHLEALARVTASEYGFAAPGYQEARQVLKLS